MKIITFVLTTLVFAGQSNGQEAAKRPDTKIQLHFPASRLDDLLHLYAHLTRHEVHVAAGVGALINFKAQAESKAEAAHLIRKSLLEQYGIELRETASGRTDVLWTGQPEFQPLRAKTLDALNERRVRVIGEPRPDEGIAQARVIKASDKKSE